MKTETLNGNLEINPGRFHSKNAVVTRFFSRRFKMLAEMNMYGHFIPSRTTSPYRVAIHLRAQFSETERYFFFFLVGYR